MGEDETKIRDLGSYSDAQDLIAVGIAKRTIRILVGPLVALVALLAWFGINVRKERKDILSDISHWRDEISSQVEETNLIADSINRIAHSLDSLSASLEDRLATAYRQLEELGTLQAQFFATALSQASEVGQHIAQGEYQLAQIDSTYLDLTELHYSLAVERRELEEERQSLAALRSGIEGRLQRLEQQTFAVWDDVLLEGRDHSFAGAQLELRFDIAGESLANLRTRDATRRQDLCNRLTLSHRHAIYVASGGRNYAIFNRFVVDFPGRDNAAGVRVEQLFRDVQADSLCRPFRLFSR